MLNIHYGKIIVKSKKENGVKIILGWFKWFIVNVGVLVDSGEMCSKKALKFRYISYISSQFKKLSVFL